jgi:hypothetical protein
LKVIALKSNSMGSGGLTSPSSAEGVGAREGATVETDGARLGGISRESVTMGVLPRMSSAKPIIRE